MASAVDFLLHAQNADGGWGYRVQGMTFVEPTAAVLLALRDDARARTATQRARDFLLAQQHADGGWGIAAMDAESGWMTAWAALALARVGNAPDAITRGAQWLLATEGVRYTDPDARAAVQKNLQIDSTLRGWPWQPGDAAWVHPTALAICALAAVGESNHARVREGVAYLRDRAAPSGGWNIGNPWMIGKPIPATIHDTAIALRALRAFGEVSSEPHIANALEFLRDAAARVQTPSELAWALWAMQDWKLDVGSWMLEIENARARLSALQNDDGSWQGNPFITAIALASQK